MSKGVLAKQLQQCLRNLSSFTDGQVQMVECDWENLNNLTLQISPTGGLYQGGRYKFKISFKHNYPKSPPHVMCLTTIFHPNIDLEANGGGVCVSLLNDWTPSNTLEDVIMSLLFLLYNPNVEDPLSEVISPTTTPGDFEQRHEAVMGGNIDTLMEDYGKLRDELNFLAAREEYEGLQQVEWDVLAEAAKAEWSYKLEQEKWQQEMLKFEQEQIEQKKKQMIMNQAKFDCTNIQAAPALAQRTDYAFGKSYLQRCATVTAPCGQANVLSFVPPDKATILAWGCPALGGIHNTVAGSTSKEECNTKEAEAREQDMDCTPSIHTTAMPQHSSTSQQTTSSFAWQPFCHTDTFAKPALHRTVTC